ncbi:sensor domain-containing diguanylate cyclase [Acinetobacter sp. ANC 4178]|uniref:sensor domain-containing diguanylate cyclase n=1 Tax=Acinetobacter sp. ANC 4178 TaxID=2529839 RepID=UPI00103CCDEB|nr:sensor domain-containing diguanylate cyclase [Acinetobacter sp. ANC 4178]TCB65953.1 sensor domain-containing diguanylate cyclase [Acinetobacter sp. ANC 4178]
MNDIGFKSFHDAGQAVLSFLYQRFGFGLWMITRVEGEDWIILQTEDHAYNVHAGQVFNWADSFCSQMVLGNGPKIAPSSDDVPAYRQAPIAQQLKIKAYIGQPLTKEDGSLFGTLCAIDPEPKSESLKEEQSLIELLGDLLSQILQTELREIEQTRKNERLQAEALRDPLTGLYNRRAWDQFILAEEERCQFYGHHATVFMLDLNDLKFMNDAHGHAAGDELIRQTAAVLTESCRNTDIIARLGGDEFAILTVENDLESSQTHLERIIQNLQTKQISAAIGFALREPSDGILTACLQADKNMYLDKLKRH